MKQMKTLEFFSQAGGMKMIDWVKRQLRKLTTKKKKEWYDDPEYIEMISHGLFPSSRCFEHFD